jgi:prepilin-type N-terminal cleavage/methylation domain-containing protein
MKKTRNKAFTLIELLLTVTILSVGIIFILRSYLALSNAISLADNKIKAIIYLDRQVDLLRLAGIEGDISQIELEEEISLNNKNFIIAGEFQPVYQQSQAEGEEEQQELPAVKEVNMTINWMQGAKQREERLVSYVASNEESEEEQE